MLFFPISLVFHLLIFVFITLLKQSTALIAGFYTSKLLCLYRRNHRFDTQNCFYTRYLSQKNRLLHKRFFCVREAAAQRNHNRHRSFVPSQQKFKCPLKNEKSIKSSSSSLATHNASPTNSDDFQQFKESFSFAGLFDKRFEKFYENLSDTSTYKKVYNVNNDLADTFFKTKDDKHEKQTDKNNNNKRNDESNDAQQASTTSKKDTDEAIDAIMENLADVVGELEYQMGCQFFQNDQYAEAADHFRMSANFNHRSAFFNLALIYEEGLGVKKDTQIAHRLYESAANLGHDKALFNLGVYAAKGIGGAKKSFRQAKKCFEKSAALGNADALEALSLLLPDKRKPYLRVPSDFIVADDFTLLSGKIQNHHTNNLRSIAIT